MRFRRAMLVLFAAPLFWAFGCGDSNERPPVPRGYCGTEDTLKVTIKIAPSGRRYKATMKRKLGGLVQFKKDGDETLGTYSFRGVGRSHFYIRTGGRSVGGGLDKIDFERLDVAHGFMETGFTAKWDSGGKIVQPPIILGMVESNLKEIDLPPKSNWPAFAAELFLNASLKTYLASQRFMHIPDEALPVGSVWNAVLKPLPGVQTTANCEIKGGEDGQKRVHAVGSLNAGGSVHMAFAGAPQFEAQYRNTQGSYRAVYIIDEKTGLPVEYEARTELQADLETALEDGTSALIPLLMEVEAKGSLFE
ncbi:MAG: hypothetical protein OXT69_00600 [Candidatus Poribacteria bacterium]|nr:hypothetical protein [Candidatus Poribacteria bacterium]